jgi:hypothetical protein
MPRPLQRQAWWPAATALLLLIEASLVLHKLDAQSIWPDEAYSWDLAIKPVGTIVSQVLTDHVPGYFLLLHFWIKAAGATPFALRYLSSLTALLAVALLLSLVRSVADRPMALLAGIIAAVNPFLLYYGQETRMYGLLLALGALTLRLVVELCKPRKPAWWLWGAYGGTVAAALYVHYYAVLLLPVLALAPLLLTPHWRKVWWQHWAALATACGIFVPWGLTHLGVVSTFAPVTTQSATLQALLSDYFLNVNVGQIPFEEARLLDQQPLPWLLVGLTLALALWGAVHRGTDEVEARSLLQRRRVPEFDATAGDSSFDAQNDKRAFHSSKTARRSMSGQDDPHGGSREQRAAGLSAAISQHHWPLAHARWRRHQLFTLAFVLPLAAAMVLTLGHRDFSPRHGIVALAGYVPLVALGLLGLPAALRGAASLALIGGFLWCDHLYFTSPAFQRGDFRGMVAYVEQQAVPGDEVILLSDGPLRPLWDYYDDSYVPARLPSPLPATDAGVDASLQAVMAGADRLHLFLWQDFADDPNHAVKRELDRIAHPLAGHGSGETAVYSYATAEPLANEPPPGLSPVGATFSGQLELLGYRQWSADDDQMLRLQLTWRRLAPIGRDFNVFVHEVDSAGQNVAIADHRPAFDTLDLTRWTTTPYLIDEYDLPGDWRHAARLEIGLYDRASGERLSPDSLPLPIQPG